MNKKAGIYAITCSPSGRQYIGSSEDIDDRWKKHIGVLRSGKHANSRLQKAWDKYGEVSFSLVVLEEVLEPQLVEREQYYLDTLHPELNLKEKASRAISGRATKKACTVRLTPGTLASLKRAAKSFGRSQSSIVEEALMAYFKKYKLDYRYLLHVTGTNVVLMKVDGDKPAEIVEVRDRNGVSPEEMAKKYRIELRGPVSLIEYPPGESTWPKNQS